MKPQRVDPITGVLQFMSALSKDMLNPEEALKKNRATATTTKLHNDTITVDTCLPSDTQIYETGISRKNIEGKWVIVEQYPDKETAQIGHKKWVDLMTEYPDLPLKDIDTWGLDKLKEELNEGD